MERWVEIVGFKNVIDNFYEVSNFGNIRYKETSINLHQKIAMKSRHPYKSVYLKMKNGKSEWVLVHQLVATFFIKIPDKYKGLNVELVPDHLDNDGTNNNVNNLEWKTRGENVSSAFKNGFINNSCENGRNALITNDEAERICRYLEDDRTYDEILKLMNYPNTKQYRTLLVRIKNGIAWKNISQKYTFNRNSIKYTKSQMETIKHLPKIRQLIKDGYSDSEIIIIIWGPECDKLKSKFMIISDIRRGKTYKNIS